MRAGIVFLLLFVPSGASCILPVCFWACFWGSLLIYASLCVCQSKKIHDDPSHEKLEWGSPLFVVSRLPSLGNNTLG